MSNFDNFKKTQEINGVAKQKIAAKFILEGDTATVIEIENKQYNVAMSYLNKEDNDKAYVYIEKPDNLAIGSQFYWRKENLYFIVMDIQKNVAYTAYNKYLAYECNVEIGNIWCYFDTNHYINTEKKRDLIEISQAKPVLIACGDPWAIKDKIIIKNRPWLIIEKDNYSTDGVTYYSLEATTMDKTVANTTLLTSAMTSSSEEINNVKAMDIITLATTNGFVKCDSSAVKFERTKNSIKFKVPFGLNEFTVTVLIDAAEVSTKYKVVL